jgi:NTP pyrophosphatase (non-canonical NTP hydrolase)
MRKEAARMNRDESRICLRAIDHWGVEHQKGKAVEEMGELIVELAREQDVRSDRDRVREELADVIVMCEQLRIIYGYEDVGKWITKKLQRLWERMRLPEHRMPGKDPEVRWWHTRWRAGVSAPLQDRGDGQEDDDER